MPCKQYANKLFSSWCCKSTLKLHDSELWHQHLFQWKWTCLLVLCFQLLFISRLVQRYKPILIGKSPIVQKCSFSTFHNDCIQNTPVENMLAFHFKFLVTVHSRTCVPTANVIVLITSSHLLLNHFN